jgi:hypothetical protein
LFFAFPPVVPASLRGRALAVNRRKEIFAQLNDFSVFSRARRSSTPMSLASLLDSSEKIWKQRPGRIP